MVRTYTTEINEDCIENNYIVVDIIQCWLVSKAFFECVRKRGRYTIWEMLKSYSTFILPNLARSWCDPCRCWWSLPSLRPSIKAKNVAVALKILYARLSLFWTGRSKDIRGLRRGNAANSLIYLSSISWYALWILVQLLPAVHSHFLTYHLV